MPYYLRLSAMMLFLLPVIANAQVTFPINGLQDQREQTYALTNAVLWVDYQTRIDSATLIIREGKVVDYGKNLMVPAGAVVSDLTGKWIYPSFIDAWTTYGMPESKKEPEGERPERGRRAGPVINSTTPGAYSWNQALRPEIQAYRIFNANPEPAARFRNAGFGMVMTHQADGIARGSAAMVKLSDAPVQELIVKDHTAACYSFNKGSSPQDYPNSEMGAIALLRQSFLDAEWYEKGGKKKEFNISIQSWIDQRNLPQFFESENYLQALRADRIGDEFGVRYVTVGSGEEYKRLAEIKSTGNTFIIPLNFPDGYDVSDPFDAINLSLGELKHWEMAPANAFLLYREGVPFAFTTFRMKDPGAFPDAVRKAVSYGLPPSEALRALTTTPALLTGVADVAGSLHRGKLANFIVTTGDFFKKETKILENHISGKAYIISKSDKQNIAGTYDLSMTGYKTMSLLITGMTHDIKSRLIDGSDTIRVKSVFENNIITFNFELKKGEAKGSYQLTGYPLTGQRAGFRGSGFNPSAAPLSWDAIWVSDAPADTIRDTVKIETPVIGELLFPNKAYGFRTLPAQEKVLFRNFTVWTNEGAGILENYDVLTDGGKIVKTGKNLDGTGARIVDGTGKHLTAGIIDEHSHIAISQGVNECSHAVTAEVRIGDVINPDDINIYRQLSGGVTTSQLLHGSCNPIGGQSALVKLRWGKNAEGMKFEGAPGFIKFALGENVKQSNWGDDFRIRYPQTRMGVEQVYVDAFTRAKEYSVKWKNYNPRTKGAEPPRRDLRLEAINEIQNGKRFITCHSYQQGEINMLMRVADSLGFRVNTFTHILEGYKVADKMKAHGAGASSFSDWWAYKFEVIEAIPYNGSILHKTGITVAYNSDDAEMARRLNQEAAKAVKYGGVSEEEAMKFVTLNPAKLLHIDHRVGSIKEGKDADLVVWNGNPLSVYSKALMTFIDGICYFDTERDEQLRIEITNERSRLLKKMMEEKVKGGGSDQKKPPFREQELFHCIEDDHD